MSDVPEAFHRSAALVALPAEATCVTRCVSLANKALEIVLNRRWRESASTYPLIGQDQRMRAEERNG
jgi:hypothetical protein